MNGHQMIAAGGDSQLNYLDLTDIWTLDTDDPADYHYGREAMHHALYTVANSHVMNGSMPGSVYVGGTRITTTARVGLTAAGVVILGLTGFAWWRHHKKDQKRKAKIAEEKAAAEAGAEAAAEA